MCCYATHVVRRGCSRSYLACCTCISAWQKCPIEPLGKESGWLLWRATELRTPFFFQTLKRAHFLKSGRKKWYTFLCTNGRFRTYEISILYPLNDIYQPPFLGGLTPLSISVRVALLQVQGLPRWPRSTWDPNERRAGADGGPTHADPTVEVEGHLRRPSKRGDFWKKKLDMSMIFHG